jgi:putative hydrolase of the HAD superfamily
MELDPYRAIVFDLFHTLTSVTALRVPGKGTSKVLGVSRQDWDEQLLRFSQDRLRGKMTDPFQIMEQMAHSIDPGIPDQIIEEAVRNRIERFEYALINIDSATIDTLKRLRQMGKLLGLVSNADVNEISGWEKSPLKDFFDVVVFSCRVGFIKPEPEIYAIALRELKVRPEDVLYVGDGGSDELRGAKETGMTTVLTIHVIKEFWPERVVKARKYADHELDGIAGLLS